MAAKPRVVNGAIADVRRSIASAITELRVQRGWDQAELARRADISPTDVQGIEAETEPCVLDTLTTLANIFEVPVQRLLEKRPRTGH